MKMYDFIFKAKLSRIEKEYIEGKTKDSDLAKKYAEAEEEAHKLVEDYDLNSSE